MTPEEFEKEDWMRTPENMDRYQFAENYHIAKVNANTNNKKQCDYCTEFKKDTERICRECIDENYA